MVKGKNQSQGFIGLREDIFKMAETERLSGKDLVLREMWDMDVTSITQRPEGARRDGFLVLQEQGRRSGEPGIISPMLYVPICQS